MVHISELSWNRIKHPSEVVNVGDTVDVYIKDIDSENKKISLLRWRLTSRILNSTFFFSRSSRLSFLDMVACEAGIKTFTPLVSARTPPF